MENSNSFLVAKLTKEQLVRIQQLEQDLRQETEENIVLIAYDEIDS